MHGTSILNMPTTQHKIPRTARRAAAGRVSHLAKACSTALHEQYARVPRSLLHNGSVLPQEFLIEFLAAQVVSFEEILDQRSKERYKDDNGDVGLQIATFILTQGKSETYARRRAVVDKDGTVVLEQLLLVPRLAIATKAGFRGRKRAA